METGTAMLILDILFQCALLFMLSDFFSSECYTESYLLTEDEKYYME